MDEARKRIKQSESTHTDVQDDNAASLNADERDMPGKMKVRVVLRQDQAAGAAVVGAGNSNEKVLYEYRTDRIVLAIVSVLLVIGGLFYLGYQLLNANMATEVVTGTEMSEEAFIGDVSESDDSPTASTADASMTAVTAADVLPAPERAMAVELPVNKPTLDNPLLNPVLGKKVTVPASESVKSVQAAAVSDVQPVSASRDEARSVAEGVQANVGVGSTDSTVLNNATATPNVQSSNLSLSNESAPIDDAPLIGVFSDAVSRASLNWRVVDLEPGRVVTESPIVFKSGEAIKRVFFYTQLNDRKDNFFFYEWFLDDRSIAKVKVGVWGNRWRSFSSKQILRKQVGNWRVTLTDKTGKVYASAQFDVLHAP